MGLLNVIKKLVYTGGTNKVTKQGNDTNEPDYAIPRKKSRHKRNRDKHMAKVCNALGLKFVGCKDDMKAVLNENGINEITNAQLKKSA